jgi:chemotaxis protein methyltransferase CheR
MTMIRTTLHEELKELLARKIGLRLPASAHERFVGMLDEHSARGRHASLEEYRTFLSGQPADEEWEAFARVFSSGETFFFRDHGQFDLLRLHLLPELIARHRDDKILRLWSAGCASGEEAYSLAMLVDMLLPDRHDWNILILGTDIDSRAIARARSGRYGRWSFRMVPAALQQRYFHLEDKEWVMDERIRQMTSFRVSNLVGDVFPGFDSGLYDMDLILCRNVFIYFDAAAISSVAAKLAATLTEGGYLLTAHTELIGHPVPGLESRLLAEGMVHQRSARLPAPMPVSPIATDAATPIVPHLPSPVISRDQTRIEETHHQPRTQLPAAVLCTSAREHADRGEYELAAQMCRKALTADPLLAPPYFLLAQLAQLKGDAEQAKEYLNKAIYIDHRCVAAYLELAALHERDSDMPRALALRQAALEIVRGMPSDEPIEEYERTAGELAQWLAQWPPSANNNGNPERSPRHGQ